jgi:hypothetical protein
MPKRKAFDLVLPEVRKPAGYGTLVAVIPLSRDGIRELWFQHDEDRDTLRAVQIDVSGATVDRPVTIKTRGERAR